MLILVKKIISEGHQNDIHNPVQILSVLQKELIHGRKLDLTDGESTCEGETNYICVNREDILKTTFMELESITDFCMTFEVDFMGPGYDNSKFSAVPDWYSNDYCHVLELVQT